MRGAVRWLRFELGIGHQSSCAGSDGIHR